jgi:hypothetical protein
LNNWFLEHGTLDWINIYNIRVQKGSAYNNLYIKVTHDGILLIEVYIDDIIFGSTDDKLRHKFVKDM